jgi:hypothetical protein
LSAVLKRRMILADKAKSLFISKYVFLLVYRLDADGVHMISISHELRTPLHGVSVISQAGHCSIIDTYLNHFTDLGGGGVTHRYASRCESNIFPSDGASLWHFFS